LLLILAAAIVVFEVLRRFGLVVVPVALALMLAAMLLPAVDFLDRYGAARGGAVAFVVILGLTILSAYSPSSSASSSMAFPASSSR